MSIEKAERMTTKQSEFLRLLLCDASGARRCRVIPKGHFEVSPKEGVGMTEAVMGLPLFRDECVKNGGVDAVGEFRLKGDPKTVVKIPWDPRSYYALTNMYTLDGRPWDLCPRSTLMKCIERLRVEFNLELDVGYEIEFQLFNQDDTPLNDQLYCSSTALEQASHILTDIYDAMEGMGIHVEQFHKESAPGQYEFTLRYSDVMDICDKLLLAREAIVAMAIKHKLKASFLPKWSMMAAGNGNHAHISFRKAGTAENVFPDPKGKYGISLQGQHFMSGLLKHLPVLTNFTVPSPNSFIRLVPSCWSGAFVCWGADNREAPVRLTSTGPHGTPTNFELKLMDASANPYVAMAALITAGMDGMRDNLPLPEPVSKDPAELSEGERVKRGIIRLPTSTGEAVQLLEKKGDIFREGLGSPIVQLWVAVRKREGEVLDNDLTAQVKELIYKL